MTFVLSFSYAAHFVFSSPFLPARRIIIQDYGAGINENESYLFFYSTSCSGVRILTS